MNAATPKVHASSDPMTDDAPSSRGTCEVAELTRELTSALNGAIVSFLLCAEFEEALDSALLRATLDDTPTIGSFSFA